MARNRSPKGSQGRGKPDAARLQMDLWSMPAAESAPEDAPIQEEKIPEKNIVSHGIKTSTSEQKSAIPHPIEQRPRGRPVLPSPIVQRSPEPAKPRAEVSITVSQPVERARRRPDKPPSLTRRQHQILDHLRRREHDGSHPPSLSELCTELGLVSRGSLHKQIGALIEQGLVEPMARKHRGVRLLRQHVSGARTVPLAGAIAAGRPIEALAQNESIPVPDSLASIPGCYALRVQGDSMRDVGILHGDIVIVEPRAHARNGEVVVALIDGSDATLKRIEQVPDEVRLHAENPAHPVQRYRPDRVTIQGVLVAQFRRYRE